MKFKLIEEMLNEHRGQTELKQVLVMGLLNDIDKFSEYEVHHLDNNHSNNHPDNICLAPKSIHRSISGLSRNLIKNKEKIKQHLVNNCYKINLNMDRINSDDAEDLLTKLIEENNNEN